MALSLALSAAAALLAGCGGATAAPLRPVAARGGAIEILEPYAPVPPGPRRASAYLTILDTAHQPDRLIRVTSASAKSVLVVSEERSGSYRSFQAVASVPVPAHGTVRLAPGGLHVVLTRPHRRLVAGDRIRLVLDFATAGRIAVTVPVVAASEGSASP